MTDQTPAHGCTIDGQPAMPIRVDEYNQLIADLAALRAVARGYCPACGRGDAAPTADDWEQQKLRADDAEQQIRLVDAMRQQNLDSAAAAVQRTERAEATLAEVLDSFACVRDEAGALLHHAAPQIFPAEFERWRAALRGPNSKTP